jgi:hypothetical protein
MIEERLCEVSMLVNDFRQPCGYPGNCTFRSKIGKIYHVCKRHLFMLKDAEDDDKTPSRG